MADNRKLLVLLRRVRRPFNPNLRDHSCLSFKFSLDSSSSPKKGISSSSCSYRSRGFSNDAERERLWKAVLQERDEGEMEARSKGAFGRRARHGTRSALNSNVHHVSHPSSAFTCYMYTSAATRSEDAECDGCIVGRERAFAEHVKSKLDTAFQKINDGAPGISGLAKFTKIRVQLAFNSLESHYAIVRPECQDGWSRVPVS